jgi:hypothetical protein
VSEHLDFHYKRDERLSMRSAPQPRGSGGRLFGRGRSVPILFVLVLIAAAIVLRSHTAAQASYSGGLAGCRVTLKAAADGDDVVAEIEVTAGSRPAAGERLFAIFHAGAAEMRVSQVVPAAGRSVTLGGRIIGAGPAREATAEVTAGGKSIVLRRALERG